MDVPPETCSGRDVPRRPVSNVNTLDRRVVHVRTGLSSPSASQRPSLAAFLPADILLLIFNLEYFDKKSPLIFSWVCRHWRAVATEFASLWTVFPHKSALFKLFMERSKHMPVLLSVGHNEDDGCSEPEKPILLTDDGMAELFATHLDRVMSLTICERSHDPTCAIFRSWMRCLMDRGPLDALQYLEICLSGPERDYWVCADIALIVPEQDALRYASLAPSLQRLVLKGIIIPPCGLYDNLTHLEIWYVYESIALHAFLELLGRSPNMRSLTLDSLELSDLDDAPLAVPGLPPFPHLATFNLTDLVVFEVTALFRRLTLPAGISHFHYRSLALAARRRRFRMPAQKLAASIHIQRLLFVGTCDGPTCRYDREGCNAFVNPHPAPGALRADGGDDCGYESPVVRLVLPEAPQMAALKDLVRWLSPNLESIEVLEIRDISSRIPRRVWRTEILPRMPALRMIRLEDCRPVAIPLLEALSVTGSDEGAARLCPVLCTLEFKGYANDKSEDEGRHDDDGEASDEENSDEDSDSDEDDPSDENAFAAAFWAALETMAATRHAGGVPLELITVSGNPVPSDDVPERIRQMVRKRSSLATACSGFDCDRMDPKHIARLP